MRRHFVRMVVLIFFWNPLVWGFDMDESEIQVGLFVGVPTYPLENQDFNNTYMPGVSAGMTLSVLIPSDEEHAMMLTFGTQAQSFRPEYPSMNNTFYEYQYITEYSRHRLGWGASLHTNFQVPDENGTFVNTPDFTVGLGGVASYTYVFGEERSLLWLLIWPLYFLDSIGMKYELLYFYNNTNEQFYNASTFNVMFGFNFVM